MLILYGIVFIVLERRNRRAACARPKPRWRRRARSPCARFQTDLAEEAEALCSRSPTSTISTGRPRSRSAASGSGHHPGTSCLAPPSSAACCRAARHRGCRVHVLPGHSHHVRISLWKPPKFFQNLSAMTQVEIVVLIVGIVSSSMSVVSIKFLCGLHQENDHGVLAVPASSWACWCWATLPRSMGCRKKTSVGRVPTPSETP